jgi:hypothetical protein
VAPIGYLNEKRKDKPCEVLVDPVRAPIVKQMFEKVANEQWSGRRLYHWLKHEVKMKSRNGKFLSLSNVYMILEKTFYYGIFEYPEGSGNWYTGNYTSIITKELYDRVQGQLTRSKITRQDREFAFTKLMTCGLCGSGISACEKYKNQKNGNIHRYVYYGCTKAKDLNCKCGYIKEEEIIEQVLQILDTLDVNEIGIEQRFKDEIARYNKLRRIVLGKGKEKCDEPDAFNAKAYAKYILTEGTITEKRELLSNLKSKLILQNRAISLKKEAAA